MEERHAWADDSEEEKVGSNAEDEEEEEEQFVQFLHVDEESKKLPKIVIILSMRKVFKLCQFLFSCCFYQKLAYSLMKCIIITHIVCILGYKEG